MFGAAARHVNVRRDRHRHRGAPHIDRNLELLLQARRVVVEIRRPVGDEAPPIPLAEEEEVDLRHDRAIVGHAGLHLVARKVGCVHGDIQHAPRRIPLGARTRRDGDPSNRHVGEEGALLACKAQWRAGRRIYQRDVVLVVVTKAVGVGPDLEIVGDEVVQVGVCRAPLTRHIAPVGTATDIDEEQIDVLVSRLELVAKVPGVGSKALVDVDVTGSVDLLGPDDDPVVLKAAKIGGVAVAPRVEHQDRLTVVQCRLDAIKGIDGAAPGVAPEAPVVGFPVAVLHLPVIEVHRVSTRQDELLQHRLEDESVRGGLSAESRKREERIVQSCCEGPGVDLARTVAEAIEKTVVPQHVPPHQQLCARRGSAAYIDGVPSEGRFISPVVGPRQHPERRNTS